MPIKPQVKVCSQAQDCQANASQGKAQFKIGRICNLDIDSLRHEMIFLSTIHNFPIRTNSHNLGIQKKMINLKDFINVLKDNISSYQTSCHNFTMNTHSHNTEQK